MSAPYPPQNPGQQPYQTGPYAQQPSAQQPPGQPYAQQPPAQQYQPPTQQPYQPPTQSGTPAGWYPDPFGRHELRYFDGAAWTEHVSSHGRAGVDPAVGGSHVPVVNRDQAKVANDLSRAGVAPVAGGGSTGSILTENILIVNQKAKLIEINNEYAIYDQNAQQIGAIRQVGQSMAKKAVRVLTSYDQFMTHKLQIVDNGGNVVLQVTRPAKFMKSRVIIANGYGQEIGQIVQQNMFGKIRFSIEAGGQAMGSISAENWRAWNFAIRNVHEQEIGRITKTFEGIAKTLFTTADNYVVQIDPSLPEPLRSLVVASALAVDTALKQDSRGFG